MSRRARREKTAALKVRKRRWWIYIHKNLPDVVALVVRREQELIERMAAKVRESFERMILSGAYFKPGPVFIDPRTAILSHTLS